MEMRQPKTRFAPSPTGLLHLGNVRTALFNYLLCVHGGGRFLLRLEDTDATRGEDRYVDALQTDLHWLGLRWHEGPGADGGHGPYAQSERGEIYSRYFDLLAEQGLAYACFCTEHELKLSRKAQTAAGKPPRYSGKCRNLTEPEVRARFANGDPATLRFRVPAGRVFAFEDKVRGLQKFSSDAIGDFIIRRSDHSPAFFFSNAVDDALMKVTLVVRGEDHLTNTPRQLMLLEALNLPAPEYAHIALVVGHDGAPLSKRNGSQTVQELRESGYLPAAVVNYLARLGHTYTANDFMTHEQLAGAFDVGRLHKAPARFDLLQLLHWQREAIASASSEALWEWMNSVDTLGSRPEKIVPADRRLDFVDTVRGNIETPRDAYLWAGNLYATTNVYDHTATATIMEAGESFFREAVTRFSTGGDFATYSRELGRATRNKGKALFMPLRAAVTGEIAQEPALESRWHDGPQMGSIWELLDDAVIRRRLKSALEIAGKA